MNDLLTVGQISLDRSKQGLLYLPQMDDLLTVSQISLERSKEGFL